MADGSDMVENDETLVVLGIDRIGSMEVVGVVWEDSKVDVVLVVPGTVVVRTVVPLLQLPLRPRIDTELGGLQSLGLGDRPCIFLKIS